MAENRSLSTFLICAEDQSCNGLRYGIGLCRFRVSYEPREIVRERERETDGSNLSKRVFDEGPRDGRERHADLLTVNQRI